MSNLISKDDDLRRSAPIIGFEVLKLIRENNSSQINILDIAEKLHKTNQTGERSIYYGIIFLYSLGIVDFNEPYLVNCVES
ncbi:MAG: hypothetical protein QNJ55_06850 [Xenococcus sp. MO_188.B8]|nr:hypothetical protein [Xenococcus sp. MO_188.B8]